MYWIEVSVLPEKASEFTVLTKNNKIMSLTKKKLTPWLIDKYSITHYMYTQTLLNLPKYKPV